MNITLSEFNYSALFGKYGVISDPALLSGSSTLTLLLRVTSTLTSPELPAYLTCHSALNQVGGKMAEICFIFLKCLLPDRRAG